MHNLDEHHYVHHVEIDRVRCALTSVIVVCTDGSELYCSVDQLGADEYELSLFSVLRAGDELREYREAAAYLRANEAWVMECWMRSREAA